MPEPEEAGEAYQQAFNRVCLLRSHPVLEWAFTCSLMKTLSDSYNSYMTQMRTAFTPPSAGDQAQQQHQHPQESVPQPQPGQQQHEVAHQLADPLPVPDCTQRSGEGKAQDDQQLPASLIEPRQAFFSDACAVLQGIEK